MVVVVVVGAPSSINVETNEGQIGVYFMVFSLHNPDMDQTAVVDLKRSSQLQTTRGPMEAPFRGTSSLQNHLNNLKLNSCFFLGRTKEPRLFVYATNQNHKCEMDSLHISSHLSLIDPLPISRRPMLIRFHRPLAHHLIFTLLMLTHDFSPFLVPPILQKVGCFGLLMIFCLTVVKEIIY